MSLFAQHSDRRLRKMDTMQILCTLRDGNSFFEVFPSDLLPPLNPVARSCNLIVKSHPHRVGGSQWLTIRFTPRSSRAYYFDSYSILSLVPYIEAVIRHNCKTWENDMRQLWVLTIEVCGIYCPLFATYMDMGYNPRNSSRSSALGATQTVRWSGCSGPNSWPT